MSFVLLVGISCHLFCWLVFHVICFVGWYFMSFVQLVGISLEVVIQKLCVIHILRLSTDI